MTKAQWSDYRFVDSWLHRRLHSLVSLCAGQKPSPSSHFVKYVKSLDWENLKQRRKLKSSERKQTSNLSALSLHCNLNWKHISQAMEPEGIDCLLITANCGSVFEDVSWRKKVQKQKTFQLNFFACNLLPSLMSSLFLLPTRNAVTLKGGAFSTKSIITQVLRENP